MENVRYGSDAAGSILRFHRLKSDHSQIEAPKPGSGEFADIDDNELAVEMVGDITYSPQDDGTVQASFDILSTGEALDTFLNNYKPVVSSSDKNEAVAWHGGKWGGAATAGSDYDLVMSVAGVVSGDSAKRVLVCMACTLVAGSTGEETWSPNEVIKTKITVQQIKPLADITFHDSAGTKTVLDADFFDIASESSDIVLAEDSVKYKYYLTDAT